MRYDDERMGKTLPDKGFKTYLRRKGVPEEFLPVYVKTAQHFVATMEAQGVALDLIDSPHVAHYIHAAREQGAGERRLRNLQIVCHALLGYFQHRRKPSYLPPKQIEGTGGRPMRVPFLREVRIEGLGKTRSSDISIGGMFIETMSLLTIGTVIEVSFRLVETDSEPMRVHAAVVYEQPELGAGLRFIDLSPRDKRRIAEFVARNREQGR